MSLEHVYRYAHPSRVEAGTLELATSRGDDEVSPHFFTGELTRPHRSAQLLLGLMRVVRARFHVPPAMLERILLEADPIVTSSDDRLRFEGFSACCGAYARVDLHPEALRGERFARGTTNVDFNAPMLAALGRVRAGERVKVSVGQGHVEIASEKDHVVERKVTLPLRWIKGLLEVQVCQRRMERVFEVPALHAARFFRSLPRMNTHRRSTWVVRAGAGLRTTQREPRGPSVRVGGLERLRVLERLASKAKQVHIYADPETGASAWVLVFDDCRFHLVISPEVWRGFSGEGLALEALAAARRDEALSRVRAELRWNACIEASKLALRAGVPERSVNTALAALGARGLVGFDLDAGAYFHRELPFDLQAVELLQPRLRAARKLVAEGRVRVVASKGVAFVASGKVEHRVRFGEQVKCTCAWYTKHQGQRGPCKHVLAAQIAMEAHDGRE